MGETSLSAESSKVYCIWIFRKALIGECSQIRFCGQIDKTCSHSENREYLVFSKGVGDGAGCAVWVKRSGLEAFRVMSGLGTIGQGEPWRVFEVSEADSTWDTCGHPVQHLYQLQASITFWICVLPTSKLRVDTWVKLGQLIFLSREGGGRIQQSGSAVRRLNWKWYEVGPGVAGFGCVGLLRQRKTPYIQRAEKTWETRVPGVISPWPWRGQAVLLNFESRNTSDSAW